MINQTFQELKGWYFQKFSYLVIFQVGILGISDKLADDFVLEWSNWSNVGWLIVLSILCLIGLFQTMIVPMVKKSGRTIYLYKHPFSKSFCHFLIDDLKQVELVKGHFQWKISIKLCNGKEINYSPSPLETDLNRVIAFLKKTKEQENL